MNLHESFHMLIFFLLLPQRIHGTGIFTYMKTIKINYINVAKYTVRPMDPMDPTHVEPPGSQWVDGVLQP